MAFTAFRVDISCHCVLSSETKGQSRIGLILFERRKIMKKLLLAAFVGILVFLLEPALQADTLTIPTSAFASDSSFHIEFGQLVLDSAGYAFAPVNLPNGAIIDGIRFFYRDNGPEGIETSLFKQSMWQVAVQKLFEIASLGAEPGLRWSSDWSLNEGWRTVQTGNSSYWIQIYFGEGGIDYMVYGAQVIYHMPAT